VTEVDGGSFSIDAHEWVLWDLFTIEPWFLLQGVLLGAVGYTAQRSEKGRRFWMRCVGALFLIALTTAALGVKAG